MLPSSLTARLCLGLSCLLVLSAAKPAYHIHNVESGTEKLITSQFGESGVDATYDYVIVGGGTAGLAIATRLAQDPSLSVAVIEAGGFYETDNGNASMIPAYAYKSTDPVTLKGTNGLIDWLYTTAAQPQLYNKTFHFVRGKCLGGSSARNYLVYNRATLGSMKRWAQVVGDSSYLWKYMLPHYKKSVDYAPPNYSARGSNATNNNDVGAFAKGNGPLKVTYPAYFDASSTYFPAAFEELGLKHLKRGVNQGDLIGYASITQTIDFPDYYRSSSQTSFLNLAFAQTSLVVYSRTMTERIIFDGNRATGVRVTAGGQTFNIKARKEVILSAGVVGSPQLLMVSGVGPKETLRKHAIPVVADLAGVGQNMEDNPVLVMQFATDFPQLSASKSKKQFLERATGPLTDAGSDLMAFAKVSNRKFHNMSSGIISDFASSFPVDWPETEFIAGAPGSLYVSLLATFSRGNITISSSDIQDSPIINPSWLSDPRDQELAIASVRYARKLLSTKSLSGIQSGPEVAPGSGVQTDAQILDWVKQTSYSIFHGSCTCKMGKKGDPMAVVDSDARVFGTRGLRVVDISAFPFLPPGQPQATVYALAEKIAARILAGH